MAQASLEEDFLGAFGEFDFPVALVRLSDLQLIAVSESLASHLGLTPASMVGQDVFRFISPEDRERSAAAVEAVRKGEIEFYHAHRRLPAVGHASGLGSQWIRAVVIDGEKHLIVEADSGTDTHPRPLSRYLGSEPAGMVIGCLTTDWTITVISSEATDAIGIAAQEAVGRRLLDLVDPGDVPRLRRAAELTVGEKSVCLGIRFPNAKPGWEFAACILQCIEGTKQPGGSMGFMVLRVEETDATASRAAQLERHLWNIAAEVESSGILDGVGKVPHIVRSPKMQMLTVRQWEIVSRLLRGERVPQIAKELFVSQSTIRNHLSQVFERFGVHSQAELLARLREEPES